MRLKLLFDIIISELVNTFSRTKTLAIENGESDENEDVVLWKRKRYLVYILTSFGFISLALMRNYLGVTILEMTAEKRLFLANGSVTVQQDYSWNSQEQGVILSAFSYGYLITQFFGGFICGKLGGVNVLGFGAGIAAFSAILTPSTAHLGYPWLMTTRAIEGLLHGGSQSSLLWILTRWAPMHERSRMIGISMFGIYIGSVVALPISGVLIVNYGWKSVSYVFGTSSLAWAALYLILVKGSPEVDPFITKKERVYITKRTENVSSINQHKMPWKGVLTSSAVWAIAIAGFAQKWGMAVYLPQLPRYFTDVMKLDIDEAGYISTYPFIFTCTSMFFSGFIIDWVTQKGLLGGMQQTRRFFTCWAYTVEGIFVIIAIHMTSKYIFIVLLTIGMIAEPLALACTTVNVVDLCPVSAPVILSLTATFSGISSIIAPIFVGFATPDKTLFEWQIVFYVLAMLQFTGAAFYWFFSKSGIQPWSPMHPDRNQEASVNP